MNRKNFLHLLAAIPALNIPFKTFGSHPDIKECKTQGDAEGPFYKSNAPARSVIETHGEPLIIRGQIFKSGDCHTPIPNAVLDVWHCDDKGHYDMRGFKGRGQITADANGSYSFTTIFPPPYGRRPRHIHIKVRAQEFPELTTQLYFQGDPNIQNDFARHAEKSRVVALKLEGNTKTGVFDIYV